MNQPSIFAHYFLIIARSLKRKNVDPTPYLAEAGLTFEQLENPYTPIDGEQFTQFMQLSIEALQDEHMGLSETPMHPTALENVSCYMAEADNLREALTRGTNLLRLLHNAYTVRLVEYDTYARLSIKLTRPDLDIAHLFAEYVLTIFHRFACWLIGKNIVVKHAGFDYPAPSHVCLYNKIFTCPMSFEQSELSIEFSRSYLDQAIVQNKSSWEEFVRTFPLKVLNMPAEDETLTEQIRIILKQHISEDFPTFELIAEQFHMSSKTLRRKLEKEGSSYQQLKNEIKRKRAIDLLTNTPAPVSQVAIDSGFSDTSTFVRAFKKWTGYTPSYYRQLN